MSESVKELRVQTVSKCTKDGAAYMAILRERDGKRILPVLMERSEAFQLLMKMKTFWEYFMPSTDRKVLKKIHKSNKLTQYNEAVVKAFMQGEEDE